MAHAVFTIIATVKQDEQNLADLQRVLCEIQQNHAHNAYLKFGQLADVHFASFTIFENTTLIFECNIDVPAGSNRSATVDVFIRTLLSHPHQFGEIFKHCEEGEIFQHGKEVDSPTLSEQQHAFLRSRLKWPSLYHVGTPYRTVGSIRADRTLVGQLDTRLRDNTPSALGDVLSSRPAGMSEFRVWLRAVRPKFASSIGIALGIVLGVGWQCRGWFIQMFESIRLPNSWPNVWHLLGVLGLVAALVIFLAVLSVAAAVWVSAATDLQAWAVGGVVVGFAASMLWLDHPGWASALVALLLITPWFVAFAQRRLQISNELAETDVGQSAPSATTQWSKLIEKLHLPGPGVRDVSLVSWAVLGIAWFALWLLVWWAFDHYRALSYLMRALVGAAPFWLEGAWLMVLSGWPPQKGGSGWKTSTLLFAVLGGVAGGILVALSILPTIPGVASFWMAAAATLIFFLIWSVPGGTPGGTPFRPLTLRQVAGLTTQEDLGVQNHMSARLQIRDDFHLLRMWSLRLFLGILSVIYRTVLPDVVSGKLFTLPTVHFAQWVLLDDGRYLFFSNYDESWNKYLDDFGTDLKYGIQKIWGQTVGNPGLTDLGKFKDYARSTMTPMSVWYSAYPDLTVRQIWNNEKIRQLAGEQVDDEHAIDAFRRLAATPRVLDVFSK
jgi:hypothetical protein